MSKNYKNNMGRCPSYHSCNKALCPLDFEVEKRVGKEQDKCRYMREPQKKKINGRQFVSGGAVMPNGILAFVPESNLEWLNEASKKQWLKICKKDIPQ